MKQIDLFQHVAGVYGQSHDSQIDNRTLYREVAKQVGNKEPGKKAPIGKAASMRSPFQRKIRWQQQTLKTLGLLEKVKGKRGTWKLTEEGKKKLQPATPGVSMLAFSTNLGLAIWGDMAEVFNRLGEPIYLCLTSPPYPLRNPRAYGNPRESEYVDFICTALEPIVANLVPGGSIVLNISNDIFMDKSPARSLYRERLVLALHDRLGLYKMDELIWNNPSKPPGPVQWASVQRVQLNVAWEPVYWFTNDPDQVRSDNRRILEPHTEEHIKFIEKGGITWEPKSYCDGVHKQRHGAYSKPTTGRIPRNVIRQPHNCPDLKQTRRAVDKLGLPNHGATMPLALARFFVEFLTEKDDLVVDPYGGWATTAKAAELTDRRWITTEKILQYIRGGAERFLNAPGFRFEQWVEDTFV